MGISPKQGIIFVFCSILFSIFLQRTIAVLHSDDSDTKSNDHKARPNDEPNRASGSLTQGFTPNSLSSADHAHSSSIASYNLGGFGNRRPLVIVSSMNGVVTALDLQSNGRKLWELDAGTGPLLSSSLSSKNGEFRDGEKRVLPSLNGDLFTWDGQHLETCPFMADSLTSRSFKLKEGSHCIQLYFKGEFRDGEKRVLPSLNGDLFTWDGQHLEACPFTADSLISSSFKLSDNIIVVGSKSTRTYGINANTGKLVYSCTPEECTSLGPEPMESDDVIVTNFQQHIVRALDQRTGSEKWNYSVGQHDVKYIAGSEDNDSEDDVFSFENSHLRISMEYNMVFGVRGSQKEVLWTHEFSSDISNVWTIIDGKVKELDILSLDIDTSLSQRQNLIPYADPFEPSFIGRFQDQYYVRPSRDDFADEDGPQVQLITDERGYGLVPQIKWRPYLSSADSRTPILSHKDHVHPIGPEERPVDEARWHQYPFDAGYSLPWMLQDEDKCPTVNLYQRNQGKPTRSYYDNESIQSNRIDVLLSLSVWTWWREMLLSSIVMAVGWHLLYQYVLKAACDVRIHHAQSEVGLAEEAVTVVEAAENSSVEFKSRYLSDFTHQECLGKGGFGIVFQAQNRVDESSYAIKRISLPHRKEARDKVLREAKALARLEHLGIVRYFQSWIEEPPPGWQEEQDQYLMGMDSSVNGPLGSFTSSANFTKDSELLRDAQRFRQHTSTSPEVDAFDGSGDFDIPVGHPSKLDDSGSFSIVFQNDPESPSSDGEASGTVPFQRYSPVNDQSDSLDIVFADQTSRTDSKSSVESPRTNSFSIREDSSLREAASPDVKGWSTQGNNNSRDQRSAMTGEPRRGEGEGGGAGGRRPRIYLYIQMQLCRKETLKDWLNQNTTSRDHNEGLHIFQQILGAVNYVHQCGMIHRDLKPSNIFFSMDGTVKIGDFGLVTAMDTELKAEVMTEEPTDIHHTSQVGTQLYMSPEQVRGDSYDHKVDIFSMGLILFELLHPFSTQMERGLVLFQAKSQLAFPPRFLNEMHNEKELVSWLLSPDPQSRPDTDDISDSDIFRVIYRDFTPPLERCRSRYSQSSLQ